MKIFIEKSKTDIYRDGKWVFISASEDAYYCPEANLKRYFVMAKIDNPLSEEYIFRAVSAGKKKDTLRACNKPLSYTSAREQFLAAVKSIGLPPTNYGLHSLRSGGASTAANNGVSDRLFKKHGRWRSEQVKDGYVKDDTASLVLVSRSLGL